MLAQISTRTQTQAQKEARGNALPTRSAFHVGFIAAMHMQPWDEAQTEEWRNGWMWGITCEGEMNTPKGTQS